MEGFLLEKSSSGWHFVDLRLSISPAAFTASPHRCPRSALYSRRHMVISNRHWFLCFAIPFLCGVHGGVSSWIIPLSEKKCEKAFEVYSLPLSVRRMQTVCPVMFSTVRTKCQKFSSTWLFRAMKYIQIFLEKWSVKVTKYFALPVEQIRKGPHTSEWISSSILEALNVASFCIFVLACLQSI